MDGTPARTQNLLPQGNRIFGPESCCQLVRPGAVTIAEAPHSILLSALQVCVGSWMAKNPQHGHHLTFVVESVGDDVE